MNRSSIRPGSGSTQLPTWLLLLVLAGMFAASLSLRAGTPPAQPPNIVIIFTDDQGYADVGVFGARGFKTPNLDRLAAEGCVYRNFHVAQAVCSASRAGLLTGCYPNRIGIHGALGPRSQVGINSTEVTLAELLKSRGYSTAMFGKWHLGDSRQFLPRQHGFDEYFGLPYSNDMWPLHPDNVTMDAVARRRVGYPELSLLQNDEPWVSEVLPRDQEQLTTWYTERAVDFIHRQKDQPFFLYLAHNMPHVPLYVSDKFRGKTARGLYGDVIEEIDWSVGEVLNALRKSGVDRRTWVIFASDNGPWLSYGTHGGSAHPLREGKGTSWEGGTRVPCIMRFPGKIPAGTETMDMMMTIDLLPTIGHLVGATLPGHPIDGMDVWPLITRQPGAVNPHKSYWIYYEQNQLQAVLSGDGAWKLQLPHTYRTMGGRPGGTGGKPQPYEQRKVAAPELYHLASDIGESRDVAATQPEVLNRLLAEAELAREELGDSLVRRQGKGTRPPGQLPPKPTPTN